MTSLMFLIDSGDHCLKSENSGPRESFPVLCAGAAPGLGRGVPGAPFLAPQGPAATFWPGSEVFPPLCLPFLGPPGLTYLGNVQ